MNTMCLFQCEISKIYIFIIKIHDCFNCVGTECFESTSKSRKVVTLEKFFGCPFVDASC